MNAHDAIQRDINLYVEYRAGKSTGLTQKALGEKYGISQSNMSRILRKGRYWLAFLRGICDADGPDTGDPGSEGGGETL